MPGDPDATASPDVTLEPDVDRAMASVPREYAEVLRRIVAALRDDPAVVALWLSGSIARGVADAGSDLDLVITIADDPNAGPDPEAWLNSAGSLRAAVDPVITLPVGERIVAFTTRTGLRVDVVVEADADLDTSPHRRRIAILGGAQRSGRIPDQHDADHGPDSTKVLALITEFLRQQAIFPAAVVARGDWLLGQEGVHNGRHMLYQLFVELNQPLPPMGVKQWTAKLTDDQRDVLTALTPPAAERDAVINAMIELRKAFLHAGRAACGRLGVAWPVEVDDAIAGYWRRGGLEGVGAMQ